MIWFAMFLISVCTYVDYKENKLFKGALCQDCDFNTPLKTYWLLQTNELIHAHPQIIHGWIFTSLPSLVGTDSNILLKIFPWSAHDTKWFFCIFSLIAVF